MYNEELHAYTKHSIDTVMRNLGRYVEEETKNVDTIDLPICGTNTISFAKTVYGTVITFVIYLHSLYIS